MQSYNHIMPKAIIKHGWATKDPENGNMSVAVLDIIRLESYFKNNKTASQNELLTKFETNFYKDEDVSPSHLIMRRNPDRIMGNRLIYNLTEENFCTLGFNIYSVYSKINKFDNKVKLNLQYIHGKNFIRREKIVSRSSTCCYEG